MIRMGMADDDLINPETLVEFLQPGNADSGIDEHRFICR